MGGFNKCCSSIYFEGSLKKTQGDGGNECSLPAGSEVNSPSLDVAVPVCPLHVLMPGK